MTSDSSLVCPASPEVVYDEPASITKEDLAIETESLTPTAPPLYPVLPPVESPLTIGKYAIAYGNTHTTGLPYLLEIYLWYHIDFRPSKY